MKVVALIPERPTRIPQAVASVLVPIVIEAVALMPVFLAVEQHPSIPKIAVFSDSGLPSRRKFQPDWIGSSKAKTSDAERSSVYILATKVQFSPFSGEELQAHWNAIGSFPLNLLLRTGVGANNASTTSSNSSSTLLVEKRTAFSCGRI